MKDRSLKINDSVVYELKFRLISRKKEHTHTHTHTHRGISYSSLSLLDLVQRCHSHRQSNGSQVVKAIYLKDT